MNEGARMEELMNYVHHGFFEGDYGIHIQQMR